MRPIGVAIHPPTDAAFSSSTVSAAEAVQPADRNYAVRVSSINGDGTDFRGCPSSEGAQQQKQPTSHHVAQAAQLNKIAVVTDALGHACAPTPVEIAIIQTEKCTTTTCIRRSGVHSDGTERTRVHHALPPSARRETNPRPEHQIESVES